MNLVRTSNYEENKLQPKQMQELGQLLFIIL